MRFKVIIILIITVLFTFSVSGKQVRVREFSFMTDDPVISSEHVIMLYVPDPGKYGDSVTIQPSGFIISHPDYIESVTDVFLRIFPTGLIEKNMTFMSTCYWGMGEEGYPFPAKKMKIWIYADEKMKDLPVPEAITFDYLTISGKIGKITFLSDTETFPAPPEIVEIHDVNGAVHLSWTAIHHPAGIKGYNIYRKAQASNLKKVQTSLRNTSFKDYVETGGEYCYAVSAVLKDGRETKLSEMKCVTHIKNTDNIITYPNPAKERITFSNLPEDAELNIFTISGERVFNVRLKNEKEYTWYLRNESGNKVSSGVYVYTVNSDNFRKKDKITILR